MKQLFYALLLSCISITSYAQFGIKGGPSITFATGDNITAYPGFAVGGFYDLQLSEKFVFEPQLMVLYESYQEKRESKNNEGDYSESKLKYQDWTLYAPLLFSYRLPLKNEKQQFSLDFGPYLAYAITGTYKSESITNGILDYQYEGDMFLDAKSHVDIGLALGLSYWFDRHWSAAVQMKYPLHNPHRGRGLPPTNLLFSGGYAF